LRLDVTYIFAVIMRPSYGRVMGLACPSVRPSVRLSVRTIEQLWNLDTIILDHCSEERSCWSCSCVL